MPKLVKSPLNIKPGTKRSVRDASYASIKTPPKRIDKSAVLKDKKPGEDLSNYSLDVMKLG